MAEKRDPKKLSQTSKFILEHEDAFGGKFGFGKLGSGSISLDNWPFRRLKKDGIIVDKLGDQAQVEAHRLSDIMQKGNVLTWTGGFVALLGAACLFALFDNTMVFVTGIFFSIIGVVMLFSGVRKTRVGEKMYKEFVKQYNPNASNPSHTDRLP